MSADCDTDGSGSFSRWSESKDAMIWCSTLGRSVAVMLASHCPEVDCRWTPKYEILKLFFSF